MYAAISNQGAAFGRFLSTEELRSNVPAAFAAEAHESLSPKYCFISTARVLDALAQAGFVAVQASQARVRVKSTQHAQHLIRLRRRFETVQLRDSIPEIVFLNSHDGTSAYQLRAGIHRVLCLNGLILSVGTFPAWRILHRGDVLDEVVRAALEISERFSIVATGVERMERRVLSEGERLEFAAEALTLRFPEDEHGGMKASQLLEPRRMEDVGSDLWRTFNVIQENVLRGGLTRRSAANRLMRTRRITAIREDLRLNSALWEMANRRAA